MNTIKCADTALDGYVNSKPPILPDTTGLVKRIVCLGATALSFGVALASHHELLDNSSDAKRLYCLAGLGVITIILSFFAARETKFKFNFTDLSVAAFLGYLSVRTYLVPDAKLPSSQALLLPVVVAFYFPAKYLIRIGSAVHALTGIAVILLNICLIQAVIALLQWVGITPTGLASFPMVGTFDNPGPLGNYLAPFIPLCLCICYTHQSYVRYYAATILLVVLLVVILSFARAAWLSGAIGIAYVIYQKHVGVFNITVRRKIPGVILILLLSWFAGLYLYQLKPDSANGRLLIWRVTLEMIADRPAFGHGLGSFASQYLDYQAEYFKNYTDNDQIRLAGNTRYAFNDYLKVTAELGVVGLLGWLLILWCAAGNSRNTQERGMTMGYFWPLAAKGALLTIAASAFFSYPLDSVPTAIFLIFCVSLLSAYQTKNIVLISLTQKMTKALYSCIVLVSIVFLRQIYIQFNALKEWKKGITYAYAGDTANAYRVYSKVYPTLRQNGFFLFNYGAELSIMGKYEQSIRILQEAKLFFNDVNLHVYLADSYRNLNMYQQAEKELKQAADMVPNMFFPKYQLVLLYQEIGKSQQAIELAQQMLEMEIKVQSAVVRQIRQEMAELIKQDKKLSEI